MAPAQAGKRWSWEREPDMADLSRVENLFEQARHLGAAEREAFIVEQCGNDHALRARLEALLAAHDGEGTLLNPPAEVLGVRGAGEGGQPSRAGLEERPGKIIGRYKLLQQIGEGGFGVVFMAEQTEPVVRKVALKIIKLGMDTRQVIARFEAERQALAMMDHANIAKVLDAGATPEGRPFFVMELVRGEPITEYCDRHNLTVPQRLELFASVCQAVQHAHQKGIIHRDIKPTNVLVTMADGKPVPKVIDFGIAKATSARLTEKTLFTEFRHLIGTPAYMSPEQAEASGVDIDTRSDIYSLGVLLYELLTGTTPFDAKRLHSAAYGEIQRIIREEEPPKPSTRLSTLETLPAVAAHRHTEPAKLSRTIRGDLDWIVMKCLEKDRTRRYETANAVATDIQRHLSDEPVLAGPPGAGYRFRKFARRNKGGLTVTALVLLFLVVLGSGVGWAVRDRAAREAEVAHERANREAELKREREARRAKLAGHVELILSEIERLQREQKWPEALAAARRAEAAAAGGEADAATAQRVRQRLKELEFLDRLEQIRMQRATEVDGKFDNAGADRNYARAFRDYGVDVEALPVETSIDRLKARPALVISLAAALDDWVLVRRNISESDAARWKGLVVVARGIDAEPLRDRLRSTWGQSGSETEDELRRLAESIDVRAQHPATLLSLARTLLRVKQSDSALRLLRNAQHVYPGDFWLNFELASELNEQKDHEGAIRFYTAAVSIRPRSSAVHNNLGLALRGQKKLDEAVAAYRKAIELDPKNAAAYINLGAHLCDDLKDYAEAIKNFRKAIELNSKSAEPYHNLGVALRGQKKLDEAVAAYRKAIELDPKFASAHGSLGRALHDQKKLDEAVAAYGKAIELDPNDAIVHEDLGNVLHAQKKLDEAIACYTKAIELDPKYVDAYYDLGIALHDQKKLDEAVACYKKAIELDPKYAAAHNNLGVVLREQRKLDEAMAAHRKAIELDPKEAAAYINLGALLCDDLKDYAEAVENFRKAIELDPKNATAHSNLGNALRGQGKLDEAIAAHRKAIEVDPEFADAYVNLGALLCDHLKDYDKAIELLHQAIDLDPKKTSAHNNLGIALYNQKKLDEAIAAYRNAIELDPKNAPAYSNLGAALRDQNKLDEAVAAFRKAIDVDPEVLDQLNVQAYFLRRDGDLEQARELRAHVVECAKTLLPAEDARRVKFQNDYFQLLLAMQRYEEAETVANDALESLPSEETASRLMMLRSLANLYQQWNKPEEADRYQNLVHSAEAAERASTTPTSEMRALDLNNRAWSLATSADPQTRDPHAAVELAQEAVKLAPNDANFWNTLGVAQYRDGNFEEAVSALQKYRELRATDAEWSNPFLLAMAHWQLGDKEEARQWFDKGAQWMDAHNAHSETMVRFRNEAAESLGLR